MRSTLHDPKYFFVTPRMIQGVVVVVDGKVVRESLASESWLLNGKLTGYDALRWSHKYLIQGVIVVVKWYVAS